MNNIIEILPVTLLDQYRQLVNAIKKLARSFGLEFGWHYLLDLCWIISRLETIDGVSILDAGAGTGILQWYLAEKGATVISVDRLSRKYLPLKYRRRYRVQNIAGEYNTKPAPFLQTLYHNFLSTNGFRASLGYLVNDLSRFLFSKPVIGQVLIYHQNLHDMHAISDSSVDYAVALSALEHNPPAELPKVVNELMRVIKPGGVLLATLGAARDQDWFHQPSQGWCYSENSLRELFGLPSETISNYNLYDQLFDQLYHCAELRDHLAKFYFKSGDNGMPWGIWNPQYQSVGVVKIKQ